MLLLTLLHVAEARTWIVDGAGGGDASTVAEGVALLSDGDTLQVNAGTYEVLNVVVAASEVRIVGGGTDTTTFVQPTESDTDHYSAFQFLGASAAVEGISFEDYAEGHDSTYALMSSGGLEVINCRFQNDGVAIRLDEGSRVPVTVIGSTFVGNYFGIYIPDTVDALVVENNLFIDNERGVAFYAMYTWGYFNLISIVHNTFVGGTVGATIGNTTRGYDEAWTYEVYLANNAFAGVEYPWTIDIASFDPAFGEVRNNVTSPGAIAPTDDPALVFSDNLEADVSFVAWSDDGDWSDDDLHLVSGSAAIDVGVDGYAEWPADFDGYARPIDGDGDGLALPDAGAYEFCPTGDCPLADLPVDGAGDTGDTGASADTGPTPGDTADSGDDDDGGSSGDALSSAGCLGCTTTAARPPAFAGPILGALAALSLRRQVRR